MKKTCLSFIVLALLLVSASGVLSVEDTNYRILIVANQRYPFYRQAVHGFRLGLREQGYHEDTVTFETLSIETGSLTSREKLKSILQNPPDLVFVVGAASADLVADEITKIPVVFSGVYRASEKLVDTGEGYDKVNFCGVSVGVPMEKAAAFFQQARYFDTLMVVVSPDDPDSGMQIADLESAGENLGFKVEAIALNEENSESPLGESETDDKTALYIPLDLKVYDSLRVILKEAETRKIPVFTMLREVVLRGAHLGFTANFYLAGEMAAFKAADILRGDSSPGELSIHSVPMFDIVINERSARSSGITFPPEIYSAGVEIIR